MTTAIAGFLVCAGIITLSGTRLSKQGSRLAEITGLSKAWIGLILMATITSLPELITGISSVALIKAPDLAVGNVLGSCSFNLLILSVLDLMTAKPITSQVRTSHVVAGSFSIILLALVGVAVLMAPVTPALVWVSPFSVVLLMVYVIAMRSIFRYDQSGQKPHEMTGKRKEELKKTVAVYGLHAVIVVLASLMLPYFGENIARETELSDTFFGTVFLAITTSLPELVISVSALRSGSADMAMGNLLGSNVFNVAILAITDFFYVLSPIFQGVSASHLFSIMATIIMTAVVAVGLVVRYEAKTWRLSIDTWVILIVYILTLLVIPKS